MTRSHIRTTMDRRALLAGASALVAAAATRNPALAQGGPIVLGTLLPLTGSGGTYGPIMRDAAAGVIRQVNEAGGVLGRQIRLVTEDDQTNPEAGVRAARKLIDVDKASAIIGTWASSITSAVAPLCWETKTFLTTVSGADSITKLPHSGYLVRTQPNTDLQGRKFAEVALDLGSKKVFYLGPQTPYAQSTVAAIEKTLSPSGGTIASVIYDGQKTTLRSEVDEALRANPDTIVMGGFTPDTTVLLKDLYRSGFKGKLIGFGFAITPKLIGDLQADLVEGIYSVSPSPAVDSQAYVKLSALLGRQDIDTYSCQVYDQTSLVILAIAAAGGSSGTDIKGAVRRVSQGSGPVVDNALDGLKALASGAKELNFEGASGSCTFDTIGDIQDAKFRIEQVKAGKPVLVKVI